MTRDFSLICVTESILKSESCLQIKMSWIYIKIKEGFLSIQNEFLPFLVSSSYSFSLNLHLETENTTNR